MTNVLRRYYHADLLSRAAVDAALDEALSLPSQLHGDPALHRRAARLADRLGLAAACDAHYLALAEMLECELWTADGRLARAVGPALPWVRLVSTAVPGA